MTPFQALYGRQIPYLNSYILVKSSNPMVDITLSEHKSLRILLKENLHMAQQRMASLTNTHKIDQQFTVRDKVYLRLKDYRQQSVGDRSSKKLRKRFYWQFKILEKIGLVAYCLELPLDARIHPVFHISRLKQAYRDPRPTPLPDFFYKDNHELEIDDELKLKRRTTNANNEPTAVNRTCNDPKIKARNFIFNIVKT